MAVPYRLPDSWIKYNRDEIFDELLEAKVAIRALTTTPFQRDWVQELQKLQFKMEIAGTSRIEGAEFTDTELSQLLDDGLDPETRSLKQAQAAAETYYWIAELPDDRPIDQDLICEIHRRMVTGCDDDHCEPGRVRSRDHNVVFGVPPHRGCEGGEPCEAAVRSLAQAVRKEYLGHDPLVRAMAVHYHFAAMHPFEDGNGRTARAIEALLLQRAGLRDSAFIAQSNYYYLEKSQYLAVLAEVRAQNHDLTAFIKFGLSGVASQCDRLLSKIKIEIKKAIFRNTMFDLFGLLKSPKKRVLATRQLEILKLLLRSSLPLSELIRLTRPNYSKLKNEDLAVVRDLNGLMEIGAITARETGEDAFLVEANLDWPSQIEESDFLERMKTMPRSKTSKFLAKE